MYFSLDALNHRPNPLPPKSDTLLPTSIATSTALLSLALITFTLRIWVRTRSTSRLSWDDFTIIIATVLSTACWALNLFISVRTGGMHTWYVPISEFENVAKVSFIMFLLFWWAVSMVKISVCFMLLRIKKESQLWFIGLWGLIAVLVSMAITVTISLLVMCHPIQANWELKYIAQPDACWTIDAFINFNYGFSTVFILTDVICALLPIAFIRRIVRPLHERIILALLMAMGLVAAVCGLMKMVLLRTSLFSSDPSYKAVPIQIWALAEAYIGITCANIPCLKSLLEKIFRAVGARMTSRETRQGYIMEDYELSKSLQVPNNDGEITYHSAVHSIQEPSKTEQSYGNGYQNDRDGGRHQQGSGALKPLDQSCYVTNEYEISWEKRKGIK